jgi:predicted acylesterase/phospholipase RssA
MAPVLQVAFQGGGARFVEMLPVAHGLADAHRKGYIRITRVAGCSAGSICAALIAYKADFDLAKQFIIDEGPKQARAMRRFSSNFGTKVCGVNIDRVRLGQALMQARHGIPFAFRTYTDVETSPYVDGGVCENLPVERLLKDEDEDGPVFAVSIVEDNPRPYLPANVKEYLLQLLSASMNHNVERAKRLVGYSNVIEAKTVLNTFDFEGAIVPDGPDQGQEW